MINCCLNNLLYVSTYMLMVIEKELDSNFTSLQQILDYDANVVPEAIVAPMLLNLCVRLRTLQACDWILLLCSCVRVVC